MEPMTVDAASTNLKLNPDFDTLVRPAKDSAAGQMTPPAAGGGNDLPFAF